MFPSVPSHLVSSSLGFTSSSEKRFPPLGFIFVNFELDTAGLLLVETPFPSVRILSGSALNPFLPEMLSNVILGHFFPSFLFGACKALLFEHLQVFLFT